MRRILPILLLVSLLAGCAFDRFALVDPKTEVTLGPFLCRSGAPVRIGEKTYRVKRLVGRDQFLTDKMRSTIIPTVEFHDAHIRDIVAYCREPGIVMNTNDAMVNPRMEVGLVVPAEMLDKIPRVTFSARLISLYKTMEVMAELTGLEFVIEDGHAWLKWKD